MNTTDKPVGLVVEGQVGDPEWVADLLDTMAQGDMDSTAEILDSLVRRLRKASKARSALTRVPAATVKAALVLRSRRIDADSCR